MLFPSAVVKRQQPTGAIRGIVRDKEFDAPLAAVQVANVETGEKVLTTDQGSFLFAQVPPGKYTLVFTKDGYMRQVKSDVEVASGQMADVEITLAGEVTEMDEFVVQDLLRPAAGSETALLKLRFDSAALMDSIGADLMSRAGVGDAAGALRLVAGASIQENKSAVIRGLPDRYVSSQMNGMVMPSADADKRAVQLDQFPAAVIESIQVSKTFTPDQQGDASGGAVNMRLKSIPDEGVFILKAQGTYNTQVSGRNDFLTYKGGGVNHWGFDDGGRDIQTDHLGDNWTGAAGTSTSDAPRDYKWNFAAGGKHEIADGVKIGGLASFYYEHYSSFFDDGQDNSYWLRPGDTSMTPQARQNTGGSQQVGDTFKTALYDVTQGRQGVRWGGLGTIGIESEKNVVALTFLYTHTAEDVATLATDTRGKEYYFPGYDPHDPTDPGNQLANIHTAPYVRLETLEYTERTTQTVQLAGSHKLPTGEFEAGDAFKFKPLEFEWIAALSQSDLNQPDKRQFGATWQPRSSFTIFGIPFFTPPTWDSYKPADNVNLGNFQRVWKDITEDSVQYGLNLKLPFDQWSGVDGYGKVGYYDNHIDRTFNQDTFSNFADPNFTYNSDWGNPWSTVFPTQDHAITASQYDIDYKGVEDISAWYGMVDLPITTSLRAIGGARYESTHIGIVNFPEQFAFWFPPGYDSPVTLHPGDADVDFNESDLLPALALVYQPIHDVTLRGSYAKTVARQTFKELTPIIQQEYLGGPTFIGNPNLQMSKLQNYDLRVDYTPTEGSLLSGSWFYKDVSDPIEYVQRYSDFTYTTPKNFPKGQLHGYELELRQDLGRLWDPLQGFSIGANATFIQSEVTLSQEDQTLFNNIHFPITTRDMTNAPDHLYNLYLTYDIPATGTQFATFYTVQGDTLVAGAANSVGNFVPDVYAKQFDTLNASVAQRLFKYFTLQFQAKNLTNPNLETVYRSPYIGNDVLKTTYTRGIELSLALTASFSF